MLSRPLEARELALLSRVFFPFDCEERGKELALDWAASFEMGERHLAHAPRRAPLAASHAMAGGAEPC